MGILTWGSNDNVQAIAAILGVFILLPLTIVTYRDAVRRVALEAPARSKKAFVLGLPIRFVGALSIILGTAILVWVGYNLLVARQKEFTGVTSAIQLVLPILLVVLGWRWFRSPLAKEHDDEAA